MISVMLEDPNFWVIAAFIIMVGLVAHPVASRIRNELMAYSQRISGDIQQCEALLREGNKLYQQALSRHDENTHQNEMILIMMERLLVLIQKNSQATQDDITTAYTKKLNQRFHLLEEQLKQSVQGALMHIAFQEVEELFSHHLKEGGGFLKVSL